MNSFIDIQSREGVLHLKLNRPEKKNALDLAMYQSLANEINAASNEHSINVILISAAGDAFCAGNDLKDFMQNPPRDESFPAFKFIRALVENSKPVIAAVNGLAVGIGTTLLLHCDLVYASPKARFSLPFVHLGLCLEAGASLLLPKLSGYQQAAELALLGEPFDVTKAEKLGLITEVVNNEVLLETALTKADQIAQLPAHAVQTTRRLLKAPIHDQLREAVKNEVREFVELLQQPAAQSSLRSFIDS